MAADTYGQALVNILTALQLSVFVAGACAYRCPDIEGLSRDVATDDVFHILSIIRISTDLDLMRLLNTLYYVYYIRFQVCSRLSEYRWT